VGVVVVVGVVAAVAVVLDESRVDIARMWKILVR
jgi:hypothetical protein